MLLLYAENRILGRFGHAKFYDLLGLDLDRFAGGRITTDPRLAIDQHQFAEAGNSRISTACFLVRLFFSAIAAAICDLLSALAMIR